MAKTILPDPRRSPRFSGLCTFGRYPRLEDVAPEGRPVDWVIYGVPFDGGVTYRPGTRFGPRAIRDASQYLKRFHVEHNVDVCEVLSLADAGDAPILPFDIRATLDSVADFAADLGDEDSRLFAIGGDHSIAYANLRATYTRSGEPAHGLAVIHFDSHLDTVDSVWGERYSHASPFRRAIEEGFIDPKRMLSIGVKGPLNSSSDLDFARQSGVQLVMRDDLRRIGAPGLSRIKDFLATINKDPVYITFDIDVCDPAFAPGTGTPSIGGLASVEALELLRMFRGVNVVGGDLVEVLPDMDPSGITSMLAAHIIFEIIALDAAARSL